MSDRSWSTRLDGLEEVALPGGGVVHVARRFNERRRGLAGLDDLPAGHGLHILRCSSIHTVGMRFALDLAWLDKRGELVRVDHDVPPWRNKLCFRAASVVEARAGALDDLLAAGLEAALARGRD